MMRKLAKLVLMLSSLQVVSAVESMPSGQLLLEMQKLNTLGSVLFVAAHPDDENTRLITYLANELKLDTTYLSLTRGDGGQNLLGTDLSEKLGIIRTQELLAARRIDGGKQLFSRANDFGFSKSSEETLRIWGKDAILADMVLAIRMTRPDVIITRFSMEPGITHGHHTASTSLAKEAFDAAADPTQFPQQLEFVEPWAAKRLIWNASTRHFSRSDTKFDLSRLLQVDTGIYNPLLGASYSEIAAQSRSAHKTQGFGATPVLGEAIEYFVHLDGAPTTESMLAGIDSSWQRVPGSEPVAAAISRALAAFDPQTPDASVLALIEAHKLLTAQNDSFWKTKKLHDLEKVIAACIGLDVESISTQASAVPGATVEIIINAIQRSPQDVRISYAALGVPLAATSVNPLASNQRIQSVHQIAIPSDAPISQPYWLVAPHELGRYQVAQPQQIGSPENSPSLPIHITVRINGYAIDYTLATTFNYNDPVNGEVKEPFVLTPPAMVNLSEPIQIFSQSQPREFTTRITAKSDIAAGTVRFEVAEGWSVEPTILPIDLKAGQELILSAQLIPPTEANESILQAELLIDGSVYQRGFERIVYDHIPDQTLFPLAQARLILLDVKTAGERIGYIPGAGDSIPEALQRIGYRVDMLDEPDMQPQTLENYDAIVLGIRALNTNDRIGFYMSALFDYAAHGGVVILQYNTNSRLKTGNFAPYPIEISRNRVTDETAEIRVLAPQHPVLNFPNAIGPADFDHWVQERGLYFPSEWDPAYTSIFSINDPDETPSESSLLIARHGEGWFVYSGLSWFRQLPAGVPGAYRIFANLVSLGHSE
jgi:LmbE family N-acetylglucosaminyl deacetylase